MIVVSWLPSKPSISTITQILDTCLQICVVYSCQTCFTEGTDGILRYPARGAIPYRWSSVVSATCPPCAYGNYACGPFQPYAWTFWMLVGAAGFHDPRYVACVDAYGREMWCLSLSSSKRYSFVCVCPEIFRECQCLYPRRYGTGIDCGVLLVCVSASRTGSSFVLDGRACVRSCASISFHLWCELVGHGLIMDCADHRQLYVRAVLGRGALCHRCDACKQVLLVAFIALEHVQECIHHRLLR